MLSNDGQRPVLPLGPRFESELARSIYRGNSGRVLAIEPQTCEDILSAIKDGIGDGAPDAIVVTDNELRPFVRRLVELEFPNVPVLSRREAPPIGEATKPIEFEGGNESANPDFRLSGVAPGAGAEMDVDTSADFMPTLNEIAIIVYLPLAFDRHPASVLLERIWREIATFLPRGLVEPPAQSEVRPLIEPFSQMRDRLYDELGILLPQVRLQRDNELPDDLFRFRLNHREFPATNGAVGGEFSASKTNTGPQTLTIENVVLAVETAVRRNAAMFQTVELTQYLLDSLSETFPDLVRTALRRFTVERISAVLRNLLDEEISVKDLRAILEGMLAVNGVTDIDPSRYIVFTPPAENLCLVAAGRTIIDLDAGDYADFVRSWRKRYISHKYTDGSNTLPVLLLDQNMTNRIRESPERPLTEAEHERLADAVRDAVGRHSGPQPPVILTDMDIRRRLRDLLVAELPQLAILCYQDVSFDVSIRPLPRIAWS